MNLLKRLFYIMFFYRWKIGLVVFALSVFFEVHGSSIGFYSEILQHPELNDVIIGKNRPIRSDEWNVFTPLAFSQYFSNFAIFSDIVRGTSTNMFMIYGQAIRDIAMIFRPSQLGFLFLDQGHALSFFWMGRLILLFLVSVEFGKKYIACSNLMSVAYAFLVTFSAQVQWWYAVNGLVEILITGQAMVLLTEKYFTNNVDRLHRILLVFLFLISFGTYILALYPAWQISFGYLFAAIWLFQMFQSRNNINVLFSDKYIWFTGIVCLLLIVANIINVSWEAIEATKNTIYPGDRFVTGHFMSYRDLFIYPLNIFLPFYDLTNISNNCEVASFLSFFPLGIIMTIFLYVKGVKDGFSNCLIIVILIYLLYAFCGFPPFLAKISLMSNVTPRIRGAIEFANLLLLFRSIKLFIEYDFDFFDKKKTIVSCLLFLIYSVTVIYVCTLYIPSWLSIRKCILATTVIFLPLLMLHQKKYNLLFVFFIIISIEVGATVNPVCRGVDSVYKQPIGLAINEEVKKFPNALWICEGGVPLNFPIMFGAKTINSINVYPQLNRWMSIDRNNNYDVYNRYAHIIVNLSNNETNFKPGPSVDCFIVDLNPADLKTLGVRYIFTNKELTLFSNEMIKFEKIYQDKSYLLYKVVNNIDY